MKAHYRALEGRITFELEAPTAKELFGEIASIQEVFEAERSCSMCGSEDVRFVVRESEGKKNGKVQTYTYYELRCQGVLESGDPCRARFDFGQSLDTENLFPKRKDADGNFMANRGWYRYQAKNSNGEATGSQNEYYSDPPSPTSRPQPSFSSGTPEGMQPIFDRLGQILDKRAPVNVGPALDMVRDALSPFNCKGFFDETYRKFQSMTQGTPTAAQYRGLFKTLMDKYFEVSSDATAA